MPFHKLDVYRKAYDLSLILHRKTLCFPKLEQYELASQVRRSSKSICANIAEGMGRQASPKDVVSYLRNSLGSCDETRIWLEYPAIWAISSRMSLLRCTTAIVKLEEC